MAGVVLCAIATALYIGAQLGPGPRDGLMTGLARRTGWSIRRIRTLIEVTVLVIGMLLGGVAGVGTVLFAFGVAMLVCGLYYRTPFPVQPMKAIGAVAVAQAPGVSRLAFGSIDYQLDLGVDTHSPALEYAAVALSVASRLADLPAPVAGVTPDLAPSVVATDAQRALALGMGAKLCIHPQQIDAARQAFVPSPATVAWAHRVVDTWEHTQHPGAVQVDARMVDKPVYLRARRLLAQSPISV